MGRDADVAHNASPDEAIPHRSLRGKHNLPYQVRMVVPADGNVLDSQVQVLIDGVQPAGYLEIVLQLNRDLLSNEGLEEGVKQLAG